MKIHNLVQGSPEWHEHRRTHFNASDAPAMLGISKYKSRTKLLDEYVTGIIDEVDAYTQKRFDDGHRFEALARPLAEAIIGKDLYPVVGSEGKLSASFDGLDIMEEDNFEHKSLNDVIRACESALDLDEMYLVQMEQQHMVSGCKKTLFMASKFDAEGNLIEKKEFWYESNADRRQRIVDGWAQFEIDAANHVPTVTIEMPKAQPVLALPALFIHAKGEITTSNMKEYGEALAKRLEDVRAIALVTDQDFSDAKEAAKLLRDNIKQANLAKDAMLSQTVTVGEAARMIDTWCEDMRLTALQLEKDVKDKDLIKKQSMIKVAQDSFISIINALESGTAPIKLNISMPNFAEAIKGKSKYDSMQSEISNLVASSTDEANLLALDIRNKQDWLRENASEYKFLFADIQTIIFKPMEDLQLLARSRILDQQRAEAVKAEAERAKIQAEEEAKARDKVAAEERQRIADEAAALAKAEAERLAQVKADEAEALAATNPITTLSEVMHAAAPTEIANVISPPELRAVVVKKQDEISTFFKTRNFSAQKEGEYRAVIVEFVKHQANFNVKQAA